MKDIIIKRPIITEKSMNAVSSGKYTFEVLKEASKDDVKKAIEEYFKVTVLKINIIKKKPVKKMRSRTPGKTSATKKAIVMLKKGDKIEIFEGV